MAEPGIDLGLAPRSAFAGLAKAVGSGAGVVATDRDGSASPPCWRAEARARRLPSACRRASASELPRGPQRAANDAVAFAGTGPGAWLAAGASGDGFAAKLREALGGLAAISDQSGGTAVLRLSGKRGARRARQGRRDRPACARLRAGRRCGHGGGASRPDVVAAPTMAEGAVFEVAVARSLAGSFWHWLAASAAEFGLTNS